MIDLVQVRNIDNKKLLSYNLVPSLYLFHEEGYMIESGKSVLVREIEVLHQWGRTLFQQLKYVQCIFGWCYVVFQKDWRGNLWDIYWLLFFCFVLRLNFLSVAIEEADLRIFHHAKYAIETESFLFFSW